MSDPFTQKFFTWIDQEGLDKEKIANDLQNTKKTLANWSSRGIPTGKRFACQAIMDNHTSSQNTTESTQRVAIEYSDAEYDTITDAAAIVNENVRKFMHRAVIARASHILKQQNPPARLVADPPATYKTE